MNLKIIFKKDSATTAPSLLTIGCGIIDATFPEAYTDEDISSYLDNYLKENSSEISRNLKSATKEYREKWSNRVRVLCNEYDFNEDFTFCEPILKITHTGALVSVTSSDQDDLYTLRFTFDPMASLLPDDILDNFIKFKILHEIVGIYSRQNIFLNFVSTFAKNNQPEDNSSTDELSKSVSSYQQKYDKYRKECETLGSNLYSDRASLLALNKLKENPCCSVTI